MARRGVARAGAELTGGGQAAAATSALVLQASVSCSGKWDGATRPHVLGGLTELVRAKYFVSMEPDVWGNTNDVFLSPVLLLPLPSQTSSVSEIRTDSTKVQNWERMQGSASPDRSTSAQRLCL